jgi:hypothetical protein
LAAKTQPVPTLTISTLAMAGPISRVAWKTAAVRDIAARRWTGGTTSVTNVCLAGESNAKITPASDAKTYT